MGRLLAWRSLDPWAGSGSRRRQLWEGSSFSTAQSSGARLHSQDGTLQLISTTLIANPGPSPTLFLAGRIRGVFHHSPPQKKKHDAFATCFKTDL